MAPRNHAVCVGSYCEAILSGEIIAGRYVELAVRRYLAVAHERGLVGFFSSSDPTGGSIDAVDEDVLLGWSTATFVFSAISMRRLYRAGF